MLLEDIIAQQVKEITTLLGKTATELVAFALKSFIKWLLQPKIILTCLALTLGLVVTYYSLRFLGNKLLLLLEPLWEQSAALPYNKQPHKNVLRKVHNLNQKIDNFLDYLSNNVRQVLPGLSMAANSNPLPSRNIPTFHKANKTPCIQNLSVGSENVIHQPFYVTDKQAEKLIENNRDSLGELECPISYNIISIPLRLKNSEDLSNSQVVCLKSMFDDRIPWELKNHFDDILRALTNNTPHNNKSMQEVLKHVKEKLNYQIPKNRQRIIDIYIDKDFVKEYTDKLMKLCTIPNNDITLPVINYHSNQLTTDQNKAIKTQIANEFPQWLCPLSHQLPATPCRIIHENSALNTDDIYEKSELMNYIATHGKCPRGHIATKDNIAFDEQTFLEIETTAKKLAASDNVICCDVDNRNTTFIINSVISSYAFKP